MIFSEKWDFSIDISLSLAPAFIQTSHLLEKEKGRKEIEKGFHKKEPLALELLCPTHL